MALHIRKTAQGEARGRTSADGRTISWLGLPYAAPPVGKLRWRAPQPPPAWEGILEATAFSAPSVQKDGTQIIGSEDCLYLNIYRPNSEEEGLPVLFFIHGGNNQTDAGEMLDGDVVAAALNAVVVTINLRLNALGWLCLPALRTGEPYEDSGNFGLLDILAALDWTRENISAFGGDARNITACGYSSGARDLLCMMISPAFRGSFDRALTFSGGFTASQPGIAAETAARALAPLAVEDGMAEDPDAAFSWLLKEDRAVRDWLCSVEAARFGPLMAGAAIRMSVFPHLFADGALIPRDGFAVLPGGGMNIPLLCLSGGHEFDLPANNDPLFGAADFTDPQVVEEYRFATKYGGALFGYINAEQNARAFSADAARAPVYVGRCLWGMDPAVTDEYAAMRMGGTHGLDLYLIMGVERDTYAITENVWSEKNRPGRIALAALYHAYLKNYIRTGDPNGPGLPLWEPWSGEGCMMRFDADCDAVRAGMTQEIVSEAAVLEELRCDVSLPPERKRYLLQNVLNGRFFSKNLDALTEKLFTN